MREYETGFLISPNLSDEEIDSLISQMAEVIVKKQGEIIKEDRWGKRKLAYPIKKFEEAFYVFFHYKSEPEVILELERQFKQKDSILRYLTVKKDERENLRKKVKDMPAEPKEQELEPKEEQIEEVPQEEEKTPAEEEKEE